jgi:AraC-like DNA-binding protein
LTSRARHDGPSNPMNRTRVWHSSALNETMFLRADFKQQSFDRHYHDEYAIGVIDSGCQAFTYDRSRRLDMPAGSVALIAPGVVHTGWTDTAGGWRYRMLYPSTQLMKTAAEDIFGLGSLATFHKPVVTDDLLFWMLQRLHIVAEAPNPETLELQALYLSIVSRAFAQHAAHHVPYEANLERQALNRVRDALEDFHVRGVTLDELAGIACISKFHLLRQFRRAFGLPPHAYLRQVRVKRAVEEIIRGARLIEAAQAAGFADQAHMTRAFRRTLGYTPGDLVRKP